MFLQRSSPHLFQVHFISGDPFSQRFLPILYNRKGEGRGCQLPQDVLPTLCRRVRVRNNSFQRRNIRLLRPSLFTTLERKQQDMRRSGYDESNSPQWRYLLSRESERKRHNNNNNNRRVSSLHNINALEEAENLFRPSEEGEVKRNRKNKKERQARRNKNETKEQQTPIHQKFTKKGKEIVYSASPGRPLLLPQKK